MLWGMGDTAGGGAGGEMQPQLQSSGSGGNGGGNGGGGVGDVEEEGSGGGLIVPTTETSKHTFFLQLALQHGFPFGQYPPSNKKGLTSSRIFRLCAMLTFARLMISNMMLSRTHSLFHDLQSPTLEFLRNID